MWHRLREAMKAGDLPPLGGAGMVVEADETYFGDLPPEKAPIRKTPNRPKFGPHHKRAIVSLVERGGRARSFYAENSHVEKVAKIVRENVAKESRLHTDTSSVYKKVGQEFFAHESVDHGKKEFARGDVTTNSIEGFFSIFKRGMTRNNRPVTLGLAASIEANHPPLPERFSAFDVRFTAGGAPAASWQS